MTSNPAYWAIIPAAGAGTRMGMDTPKQYLTLNGKSVLEHSVTLFCRHPQIQRVVVVLADQDPYWHKLTIASDNKILTASGGAERCHSVRNGLTELASLAAPDDWVLIHDAARPCLRRADIDKLINALSSHPIGGILASPVKDTIKRVGLNNEIEATIDRERLWHALTPQMFRVSMLTSALDIVIQKKILVTDEAQAMEINGMRAKVVEGHPDNIKITHPHDLLLAELYLSLQGTTA